MKKVVIGVVVLVLVGALGFFLWLQTPTLENEKLTSRPCRALDCAMRIGKLHAGMEAENRGSASGV